MAGTHFSSADVYLGWQIGWGLETMKTIDERPVFVDFWKRVRARKAYHRANALDDALLPEQPTSD